MSDKSTLLQEADEVFAGLERAIDGLGEEAMGQIWLGTWGVREIVIHISGWHRAMIPALDSIARGEPSPYPAGTYDDFDAWNARFVADKAGVKVADVLAELRASHHDFIAAATAIPEEHFAPGGAALGPFDGAGAGHYREHAAQIRQWRQAAGR
jgi:hypothetical protein